MFSFRFSLIWAICVVYDASSKNVSLLDEAFWSKHSMISAVDITERSVWVLIQLNPYHQNLTVIQNKWYCIIIKTTVEHRSHLHSVYNVWWLKWTKTMTKLQPNV